MVPEAEQHLNQSQDAVLDTASKMNEVKNLLDSMQNNSDARKEFAEELTKSVEGILNSLDDDTKVKLTNSVMEIFNKHQGEEGFDSVKAGLLSIGNILGLNEKDGKLVQTQVDTQTDVADDTSKIELPTSPLKGKLEGITQVERKDGDPEDKKGEQNFYKGKNETVGIYEVATEGEKSELDKTIGDLKGQIVKLDAIDESKLSEEDRNKINQLKNVLGNMNDAINNTTPKNVVILQSFISENLSGTDEGTKFDQASKKKNGEFDGKFGVGTLAGLNKVLEKTGTYITNMEKYLQELEKFENQKKINAVKPKENVIIQKGGTISKDTLLEGLPELAEVTLGNIDAHKIGEQTVNVAVKLGSKIRYFDIKVNIVENLDEHNAQQKLDKTPLTIGDDRYQVLSNSATISSRANIPGATFYTTKKFEGNDPDEGKKWETVNASPTENQDYECFMKLNNGNVLKVKVDQNGNLCPIATKFDNKLNFKDGGDASERVLLSNNPSCMRYLYNKLPDNIKDECRIGWSQNLNNYNLTSHGGTLSIEPMTIAGDWISSDLGKNLAFLNLTNYLRDLGNKNGKRDPDVNRDLQIKGIRKNGKKVYIDKNALGLANTTPEELAKFKRYNNREDFYDNWDRKGKNKNYTKIILQ